MEGLQALSRMDWNYTTSYDRVTMRSRRTAQPPLQVKKGERGDTISLTLSEKCIPEARKRPATGTALETSRESW